MNPCMPDANPSSLALLEVKAVHPKILTVLIELSFYKISSFNATICLVASCPPIVIIFISITINRKKSQ